MGLAEDHLRKKRKKRICTVMYVWALLVALCMLSAPVRAENMIKTAKQNKIVRADRVRDKKGIRFQLKSGRYLTNRWVSYKGEVYCLRRNGYARRKGFFKYKGKTYYADQNGVIYHQRWITQGKYYYYMKRNGVMAAGETLEIGNRKYVFKKSGRMDAQKSDSLRSDQYIFVGDSRVVGMGMTVSDNGQTTYIGRVAEGIDYLESTAGPKVKNILNSNPNMNVIFCFGVNDLGNVDRYISYYKSIVKEYPKTDFYFMAVNPVRGYVNTYLNNSRIEDFNRKLKSKMGKRRYIDTYGYLNETGIDYYDYAHYTGSTYQKIYDYTVKEIQSR